MHITEKIKGSPNYKKGSFQNLSETPVMAKDSSWYKLIKDSFSRPKEIRPSRPLPSIKTDLKNLHSENPVIIWFGHSSYLIHVRGKNILVDPVFSGYASPVRFLVKAFAGTDIYTPDDLPPIDLMILTHNHYDHFDTHTISRLHAKTRAYCVPLGVRAGFQKPYASSVTELDWWETERITNDIGITATPARHFSGRGLKRGGSLWCSFVLRMFGYTLYIGGDSGYDAHFREIGKKFGGFDLAILECGQYNTSWPFIHMMPEETVQAGIDLNAKWLLPVHWGKFVLANHPWNEPVTRAVKKAAESNVNITTPLIGEPVIINESYPAGTWWKDY
ncbi:MBL fold metallo-hydrolase [Agriterribacter sp.]|uniref:MBL fold metallo-hydrolase n=1 Tax=Agriterribacter sp. TaxID=2821509 RepID=UPI002BD2818F|nr:MBL fold metallo-hydrolase [Agriterribacter sp.]HRP58641.1 MBL fold metallo-hydrolase [Agriterribacter sp.]